MADNIDLTQNYRSGRPVPREMEYSCKADWPCCECSRCGCRGKFVPPVGFRVPSCESAFRSTLTLRRCGALFHSGEMHLIGRHTSAFLQIPLLRESRSSPSSTKISWIYLMNTTCSTSWPKQWTFQHRKVEIELRKVKKTIEQLIDLITTCGSFIQSYAGDVSFCM